MPLELWGGHECSLIRTGDQFTDQTVTQGHQHRIEDLELFASLGLKALRYPVLWERTSPDDPTQRDFSWSDERLRELRKLGIRPIVGLIHHGSGPRYTNLLDPGFATGLADHARAVAERYAWVEEWNPVNEPLTTARFSCLYGVWYPHKSLDEGAFWLALLNEVNAVRLSMRAIREINPKARLVQTDDLGFTHATPTMAGQAEFENHRRWITWDLLCGRVVPGHPLWSRIASYGLDDRMKAIADDPCPPDVIGANYYAASERLIDQRSNAYPGMTGQDGPGEYANADAARSIARPLLGREALLLQCWERYKIPLGVTETHNVGTRDEQMRWILETWRGCEQLRQQGVQVESVTAWALLGSFDWKTLGVEKANRYEVGVFDLGGGEPRATGLVPLLKALAAGEEPPANIAFASAGWWRKATRFDHDTEGRTLKLVEDLVPPPDHQPQASPAIIPSRPLLITGLTGTLGRAFDYACELRGLPHVMTDRARLQLEDRASIDQAIRDIRPYAIINAAGWSSIERAEDDPLGCMEANSSGAHNLALAAKRAGIQLVTFSSDMVFDGTKDGRYCEWDEPRPLNVYGRSKAEAERRVLSSGAPALVVRTATFFSPHDANNFAARALRELARGRPVAAAGDLFMSPTYVPDLVDATLDLLIDGETGLWHLSNPACCSWAEFVKALAEQAGFDPGQVQAVSAKEIGWHVPRPPAVPLGSARGALLSELAPALGRFVSDTRLVVTLQEPEPDASQRDPVVTIAAE